MTEHTRASAAQECVRILRAITAAGDNRDRRTMLIRDLAEALVELREHYLTDEGEPDYAGRTWAYRDATSEIYAQANIGPKDRRNLQSTVRYHVGNILRERLSEQQLADIGLSTASPLDRVREHRADAARTDPAGAVAAALAGLTRAPVDAFRALRGRERRQVMAALDELSREVDDRRE